MKPIKSSDVATTRAGRQARIVAVLSSRQVHSQAELAALLVLQEKLSALRDNEEDD